MKKFIVFVVLFIALSSNVFAATVFTDVGSTFSQNTTGEMQQITITATSDNEITQANGINFLLEQNDYILWNDNNVTVNITNNGVYESHIVTPEFNSNYKVLYIPIQSDLSSGATVVIIGMKVKTYNSDISRRYIKIDLNGDLISDLQDGNGYKVTEDEKNNIHAPYPVTNAKYAIQTDGSILLTWDNPPDYDYEHVTITRYTTSGGVSTSAVEISSTSEKQYNDKTTISADSITYSIYSRDYVNNAGNPVVVTVDLNAEEQPEEEQPSEEPAQEPTDELVQLDSLFNYYKIRYSIKCMPSGIPALQNDSACLWARIDLVYAQEKLDKSEVNTSVTDYDIALMSNRVKYPEQRYQTNCVESETPADYCSALGKAIDRIHYFIEK